MEPGRIILAIVLSLAVFVGWNLFFADHEADQQPAHTQTQPADQEAMKTDPAPQPTSAPPVTPAAQPTGHKPMAQNAQVAPETTTPSRKIKVETPLYSAELSEQGGNITSFTLKHYRESVEKNSPFKQLISKKNPLGTLRLDFADGSETGRIEGAHYQANTSANEITVTDKGSTISFAFQSPAGILIQKTYSFSPDTYLIDFDITLSNQSERPITAHPTISLVKFAESQSRYGFTGPSGYINGHLKQIKKKKIDEIGELSGNIEWIALEGRYFFTSVEPNTPENHKMRATMAGTDFFRNQLIAPATTINPGTEKKLEYQVFFGPKSLKLLRQYDHKKLDKIIYYGWFDFLAKPFLWIMNFIHDHIVANYGIAIILLTLLTKIVLWPLGQKSYKSMAEMKKLQPLMTEIREKYKHDKRKMNEEVMALYRTYKVSPMGGCLPMIVQIPVFIALYRMLYQAIELRHAPFFGWINDLSAPDRLFHFGFSIPIMHPPYGIPVLTLVMGATMFLQQKLQPAMGDPTQAKLMMLMPIFFTVIFINFPAGLVLYWLVNNVFSIAQQRIVQRNS